MSIENPYTFDEDQFEFFTEAVSAALEVADIPSGVISGSNIADGSILPENCALDAGWDFSGGISSPEISRMRASQSAQRTRSRGSDFVIVETADNHKLGKESLLIANAQKKSITIVLPPAAQNEKKTYYIKRADDNKQTVCVVVPTRGDKIDLVTSISIPARGCILCVSSGENWYILSNYS
jgi:hypothetical protein